MSANESSAKIPYGGSLCDKNAWAESVSEAAMKGVMDWYASGGVYEKSQPKSKRTWPWWALPAGVTISLAVFDLTVCVFMPKILSALAKLGGWGRPGPQDFSLAAGLFGILFTGIMVIVCPMWWCHSHTQWEERQSARRIK